VSTIDKKIRTLRENREWSQKQVAEHLDVSESTVQKWEKGVNVPPIDEAKRICQLFGASIDELMNDDREVTAIYKIDEYPIFDLPGCLDGDHRIYDADLKHEGVLHRFENAAGVPYSAIYRGGREWFSCERDREKGMIDYWNSMETI